MIRRTLLASLCLTAPLGTVLTAAESEHGHTAVHGGCLNELGACENGHAEVKIEGTTLRLWFVGGGTQTGTAVRVTAPSLTLTTRPADRQAVHAIVLTAKPLALAEEKPGDCSYFEGAADWLAGVKEVTLSGQVLFRGADTPITIIWPSGYETHGDEQQEATPSASTPASSK